MKNMPYGLSYEFFLLAIVIFLATGTKSGLSANNTGISWVKNLILFADMNIIIPIE